MTAFVLTDSQVWVGSHNATTFTGSFTVSQQANMVQANVFGGGGFTRSYPGLKTFTTGIEGFADYDAAAINTALGGDLGNQELVSIAPTGGATAGDPVIFTRGLVQNINTPGGPVGEMASFGMTVESDTAQINGIIAAPLAARTSTGNGTIVAMTGPSAAQRVWLGLHVFSVAGTANPSMTVALQSAAAVGFASPTTRLTLAAATSAGWQFASTSAGAITDGFWRVTFTISGTNPSFSCAAVLGVM